MSEPLCACGLPLHYTDLAVKAVVDELSRELGEFMPVSCNGHTYRVQRHYIALHGLKGAELPYLADRGIVLESDEAV